MAPRQLPSEQRQLNAHDAPRTLRALLRRPGVVEQSVLRSTFGLMAIHGGGLEMMTDVIAATAAEHSGASCYAVIHPDDVDFHLPSAAFRRDESAALHQFLDHVDVVIGIHGYGRDGSWTSLLLGGTNRALAADLGRQLDAGLPDYDVVTDLGRIPRELRGLSTRNPVNVPAGGGVQLELPPRVRGLSPSSPPPGPDGWSPPLRALIDALAAVARRWGTPP